MNKNARRILVVGLTFIGGLYFFLEFVLPEQIGSFKFGFYHEQVLRGLTVMGSMAFGLGLINILRVHGGRLIYGAKGWSSSLALLAGMILMFIVQGGEFYASQSSLNSWKPIRDLQPFLAHIAGEFETAPALARKDLALLTDTLAKKGSELSALADEAAKTANEKGQRTGKAFETQLADAQEKAAALGVLYAEQSSSTPEQLKEHTTALESSLKQLLPLIQELTQMHFERSTIRKASSLFYNGFFVPLGTAMFALLAFYIATAAYRSFRLKSMEAAVMMSTAVVVILGQISYGPLYISEKLPAIRLWLLENVNTPGNRAIYFGAAVGGLAMAVRMWLSLERNPLDVEEK